MFVVCLFAVWAPLTSPLTITVAGSVIEVRATLPEKLAAVPSGSLPQEQGERWLRFCLVDGDKEGPAILGNYQRRQDQLSFTPRHPLVPGQLYRATLSLEKDKTVATEYRVPVPRPSAPAVVERIYPTAAELPANQLKFYLHFSRSMRENKDIFEHIHLLEQDGKPVLDPWRHTELWSSDGKRLTLWIHPGRVKRGVNLREELGTVLSPGRHYTLVIGADLQDAEGQSLGKDVVKKFRATAEKRTAPHIDDWKLDVPAHATRKPLVVHFPEPFDRALLERFLRVVDDRGAPVVGRIEVGPEERSWLFHPERPWKPLDHALHIDGRLEDLAGNTPGRLFDVDLADPPPPPPKLTLSFRMK